MVIGRRRSETLDRGKLMCRNNMAFSVFLQNTLLAVSELEKRKTLGVETRVFCVPTGMSFFSSCHLFTFRFFWVPEGIHQGDSISLPRFCDMTSSTHQAL